MIVLEQLDRHFQWPSNEHISFLLSQVGYSKYSEEEKKYLAVLKDKRDPQYIKHLFFLDTEHLPEKSTSLILDSSSFHDSQTIAVNTRKNFLYQYK